MITGQISAMQHFSTGDGPGIRTTVFFQGCNLRCGWCHNPETIPRKPVLLLYKNLCAAKSCGRPCAAACPSGARAVKNAHPETDPARCALCGGCARACPTGALMLSGVETTLGEVMDFIDEDAPFYEDSGGGVTLSGGEPLLQPEFAAEIGRACRERGYSLIIDTAGNVEYEAFRAVAPYTESFYFDLKGASDDDYKSFAGGSFDLTLKNLRALVSDGCDVTVRIPVIPGYNDSEDYMRSLSDIILRAGAAKVSLLPFHGFASGKYGALGKAYPYRNQRSQTDEELLALKSVFSPELLVEISK